jgi:hypothetical protein
MAGMDWSGPGHAPLREAIAAKVLAGWAANRQQVAVPLALNLGRMEAAARGLVLAAMVAGVYATGEDPARLPRAVERLRGDPAELPEAPDVLRLVAAIEAAGLGAHAYAATSAVLDRGRPAARAWLDWLAARFALPPALLAGLARRYRG